MPPPPAEKLPPEPMGIPPPPIEAAKPKVPGVPPMPKVAEEVPPKMPSFEAVEEQISQEEEAKMEGPARGPLFIRADNYKYVLDELNVARNIAKESSEIFAGINDISASSEQEYEHWRVCLEDVERKMLYVDKSLFGKR